MHIVVPAERAHVFHVELEASTVFLQSARVGDVVGGVDGRVFHERMRRNDDGVLSFQGVVFGVKFGLGQYGPRGS